MVWTQELTYLNGIWSCGWKESWEVFLIETDISRTWAEVADLQNQVTIGNFNEYSSDARSCDRLEK